MVTVRPPGARTIDEILLAARARLRRLTPQQAFGEVSLGGVLTDIRPAAQRAWKGEIPRVHHRGAQSPGMAPRSVLGRRLSWVTGYDHRIIVICVDGYTSSLAAAALLDLGLHRATDMIGGFRAWTAESLPSAPGGAGTVTLAPGAAPAL